MTATEEVSGAEAADLVPDINGFVLRDILNEVGAEIVRATAKHGKESMAAEGHDVGKRLGILGEEFGEVCRATTYDNGSASELRSELVQTAAMAVAWVLAELPVKE